MNKILTNAVAAACLGLAGAAGAATVTIATINNPDMIELQKLSKTFETANPDIQLRWVTLEENVLRQRVTTDIATGSGQFDLMTIGAYEAPIWAKKNWLTALDLPASYDVNDVIKTVRDGLSLNGKLYAVPFYAESSMTYYRKDLFDAKGLKMPEQPTWTDIQGFAQKLTDKSAGVYGICLRGQAGWGENMALVGTMVNSYGGRWFDMQWKPTIDTPEWKKAVSTYVDILGKYGPPGASANGFNENLVLFSSGKCAMWVDATVAAGMLYSGAESKVADKVAFAASPMGTSPKGSHWLWMWSLAVPKSSKNAAAAQKFAAWATSKEYIQLVAKDKGWAAVPSGTRESTYASADYQKAAPFASFVRTAITTANPTDPTVQKVPYIGVQFATIPEFQSIGTVVGQNVAGALTGKLTVDAALKNSQASTERAMKQAGYVK